METCPNCFEESASAGQIEIFPGIKGCFVCKLPVITRHGMSQGGIVVKGDNPFAKDMSRAKEDVIRNQIPHPENPNLIIDRRTGKEAPY